MVCARCCGTYEPTSIVERYGERMCVNCADLRDRREGATTPKPAPSARRVEPAAEGLLAEVRRGCAEAEWLPRLPIWLGVVYLTFRYLTDVHYRSLFGGLNFGIHEAGHVVFGPFGMLLGIAGGTLLQLAAPIAAGVVFLRQRDWFAITVALAWLGTNGFEIATYAADARSQALPLLGLGAGEPIHDWNFLLGRLGLLHADHAVAGLFRLGGGGALIASVALGGWLLVEMARTRRGV